MKLDYTSDPSIPKIIGQSAERTGTRTAIAWVTNSHSMNQVTYCSDAQGNLVPLERMNPRPLPVAHRNASALAPASLDAISALASASAVGES